MTLLKPDTPPLETMSRAEPVEDRDRTGGMAGRDLRRRVATFQKPVMHRSLVQTLTSVGGYLAVCAAMYLTFDISVWISLALAPLAAGLLVRTFIIQHDCGHGAFFRSRRLNDALGFVCSLLTLAPYASWRRQHAGHHGVWNNLDRRDTGVDIYSSCLTVEEYRALGPWRRRWYRFTRNPAIANVVAPPLVFVFLFRVPFDMAEGWGRERIGVYVTNIVLILLIGGLGLAVGFGEVAAVQLPIIALASIIGAWLFTVQHRADDAIWARENKWSALSASLKSSTHLRLTPMLQWFTGNIGLHHVHHLNPKIPNYQLQRCHDSIEELSAAPQLTLRSAFRTLTYTLWDEEGQHMVTFRDARKDGRQG